jgi:hypothetical protein
MPESSQEKPEKPSLDPTSLTVKDAARMLALPVALIRQHIDAGAPMADGKMNLVHYAAWLNSKDANAT